MVMQCQVCKKSKTNFPNLTFHRFPTVPKTLDIWKCILGYDSSITLAKSSRICSEHFFPKDFHYKRDGKKYLNNEATPIPKKPVIEQISGELSSTDDESSNILNSTLNDRIESLPLDLLPGPSSQGSDDLYLKTLSEDIASKPPDDISKDEWYHFGTLIACQLRTLPIETALRCQKQIVDIMTRERLNYLTKCKSEDAIRCTDEC